MATYIVGDVQGCFDELMALLDQVSFNESNDQLWFTGDLVNRGPKSLDVLRFAHSLGDKAKVVLGNHDLQLLAVANGAARYGRRDTFKDVFTAPDGAQLLDWLCQQPFAHYDDTLAILMIHAGLPPQWSLEEALAASKQLQDLFANPKERRPLLRSMYQFDSQHIDNKSSALDKRLFACKTLTSLCYCYEDGGAAFHHSETPGNQPDTCLPWYEHPERKTKDVTIVFGHWNKLDRINIFKNTYALDTGCVAGRDLTIMRVDDTSLHSTSAPKNYLADLPQNPKWRT